MNDDDKKSKKETHHCFYDERENLFESQNIWNLPKSNINSDVVVENIIKLKNEDTINIENTIKTSAFVLEMAEKSKLQDKNYDFNEFEFSSLVRYENEKSCNLPRVPQKILKNQINTNDLPKSNKFNL